MVALENDRARSELVLEAAVAKDPPEIDSILLEVIFVPFKVRAETFESGVIVWALVKVWAIPKPAKVVETDGKVSVVESVPDKAIELLTVKVLEVVPPATLNPVELAVNVRPFNIS